MAEVGRPSSYNQETAVELCEHLAMGESLRTATKPEHMPSIATVFKWMRDYPEFLKQYAKAKQEAADAMAEDIMDIADDGTNDWMEFHAKDNQGWKVNGEALARSRLRVDTRKFLMAKMKPKKYGERIQHANDPDNPMPTPIYGGLDAVPRHDSDT